MIWRGFRVFLVVIFVALLCRACLVKDVPTSKDTIKTSTNEELSISYPTPKNVTINGVDYLESQAPIGKFGGEMIESTIGEGPKHLILSIAKTIFPLNCRVLCMTVY